MADSEQPEKRNLLIRFFSHPVVGISGSLASFVGVGLAILFFVQSRQEPNVTFFTHPVKGVVFRAEEATGLQVTKDGVPIETDVTTSQFAFWNAGKLPVESGDILVPLTITCGEETPILEARILKASRELTEIAIDDADAKVGKLRITWKILELGDGASVQLILSGATSTSIEATGTFKGQKEINIIEFPDKIASPHEQFFKQIKASRLKTWGPMTLGSITFILSAPIFYLARRRRLTLSEDEKDHPRYQVRRKLIGMMSFMGYVYLVAGLVLVALGLFQFFSTTKVEPPFGF